MQEVRHTHFWPKKKKTFLFTTTTYWHRHLRKTDMFLRCYYEVLSVFPCTRCALVHKQPFPAHMIATSRQREPAVWRLWAVGEWGRLPTDLSARRSAWKALSEITSRHSWCEGGETADVNVVLTDWAMCTMSAITGSTGWQDCSANLRGEWPDCSRAERRRSLDGLKNHWGKGQCVNTELGRCGGRKHHPLWCWFHTRIRSNALFPLSIFSVTPVILLQLLTAVIMAWDYPVFSWLTVTILHSHCIPTGGLAWVMNFESFVAPTEIFSKQSNTKMYHLSVQKKILIKGSKIWAARWRSG